MNGGRSLLAVSCVLAALIAGCGGGSEEPARTAAATTTEATPPPPPEPRLTPEQQVRKEQREARRAERARFREASADFAPNPDPMPRAMPAHPRGRVDRVIVRDIRRGRGPALGATEAIWADYAFGYYRTGEIYYGGWGRGRTANLVRVSLTRALNRAIEGMRPGGRRIVVVPKAVADVHEPKDESRWEIQRVDIVLRSILPPEEAG